MEGRQPVLCAGDEIEQPLDVAKFAVDQADRGGVDAGGNEVYRQRQGDDIRFPQAEAGSSGGRITGNFAVPGPGSYTLKLQITDLAAGDTIEHEVAFEIP